MGFFDKLKNKAQSAAVNVMDAADAAADKIGDAAESLEEKFELTITEDMLNEAITWCNKERIQAARIYELGKYDPPAITGTHMRDIMEGEQYLFDRELKYEKLKQIRLEKKGKMEYISGM